MILNGNVVFGFRRLRFSRMNRTKGSEYEQKDFPAAWYEPLYAAPSHVKVNLVFVRKRWMIAAVMAAEKKNWNVPSTLEEDENVETVLSQPDTFSVVWTSQRSMSHHPSLLSRLDSPSVLINCIPNAQKLSINKWDQYKMFQDFLKCFGTSVEELKIMPLTFLVQDLLKYPEKLKTFPQSSMWILKKCFGQRGDGIKIMESTLALKEFLASNCSGEAGSDTIVQEYVGDLMLVNGRKFDIRVPILIASTKPFMLFLHKGYLRVAFNPFNPKGTMDVHLTNSWIQKEVAGTHFNPDEHFWSFSRLQAYLDQHQPDNGGFVANKLIPSIKRIAIFLLRSGIHMLERRSSCYQLIGIDLLVSSDGCVRFIESNSYPLLDRGGWITDFSVKLAQDMFDLAIEIRKRPRDFIMMPEGEWLESWQLIWREKPQNENDYNPCKEFSQLNN